MILTGRDISLGMLHRVARKGALVRIAPGALERMAISRQQAEGTAPGFS